MEPGELLGLLGPNGAGKLTLTKIACVGWCGRAPATPRSMALPPAPGGAAVGYLAELFRFPEWLSADELIALHQSLAGSDGGPRERGELPDLVGLAEARRTKVDAMSKSMQQPLGIAQALVGRPRLVMLDEPASARSCFVRRVSHKPGLSGGVWTISVWVRTSSRVIVSRSCCCRRA